MEQKHKAAISDIVCLSPDRLTQRRRHGSTHRTGGLSGAEGEGRSGQSRICPRLKAMCTDAATCKGICLAKSHACNWKAEDDPGSAKLCLCAFFCSPPPAKGEEAQLLPQLRHRLPSSPAWATSLLSSSCWGLHPGAAEGLPTPSGPQNRATNCHGRGAAAKGDYVVSSGSQRKPVNSVSQLSSRAFPASSPSCSPRG